MSGEGGGARLAGGGGGKKVPGRRGRGPGGKLTNHPRAQKPQKGVRRERRGRAPEGQARQGGRTGPAGEGPGRAGDRHRVLRSGDFRKWLKGTIGR